MSLREAAVAVLSLHDFKGHAFPAEQAAWTALREAVAQIEEFDVMGTGVTQIRELKAQVAAHDSRVCGECGQRMKRVRTGRSL